VVYLLTYPPQEARLGDMNMLLLKVLGENERKRRQGKVRLKNRYWDLPVFELITGEPGERIRAMRTMNSHA